MPERRFRAVTVACSDVDAALALWTGSFALAVLGERPGGDPALAGLWGIEAAAIGPQYLLGMPGATHGCLHLAGLARPAAPVREGAASTDRCPKNIDLYCADIDAAAARLAAAGRPLRAPPSSFEADGMVVREAQCDGPDGTNLGIMELGGVAMDFGASGFAGIGPVVTTVADIAGEQAFYEQVLALAVCTEHRFAGPAFEKLIGLPAGAGLALAVLGEPEDWLGRVELVEYEQVAGRDLYPRARAPATGTLHLAYQRADAAACAARAGAAGGHCRQLGALDTLAGTGECFELTTPAGFRLYLFSG